MYITTRHAREVTLSTALRACAYALLPPQYTYIRKIKSYIGASSLQYLNSESFLHDFFKIHPERQPGCRVAIEKRYEKRFTQLIERSGLVPLVYSGQKELSEASADDRVLAIIVPEAYAVSSQKYKRAFEMSRATKIVFQSRKKPRAVSLEHDVYMWEPRSLPRAISGTIVYIDRSCRESYLNALIGVRKRYKRVPSSYVIAHIVRAVFMNKEDRYRALNKKPAHILSRLVYDFL